MCSPAVLNGEQILWKMLFNDSTEEPRKLSSLISKGGLRKKDHQLYAKIMKLNAQFIGQGKYPKGLERRN